MTRESYFNSAFVTFFENLSAHNSTQWFDENRGTYEKEIKKPFSLFVGEMIRRISEQDPEITINPQDTIFRINRDTRFSKEKIPYNTHMAANISPFGRKDKSYPGFYFKFSHQGIEMIGGSFVLDPAQVEKVRRAIIKSHPHFVSAYNNQEFRERFGMLQGEKSKKLPPEFNAMLEEEPYIANKQFYYRAELLPEILFIHNLPDTLMEFYNAGKKLNDFLKKALKT